MSFEKRQDSCSSQPMVLYHGTEQHIDQEGHHRARVHTCLLTPLTAVLWFSVAGWMAGWPVSSVCVPVSVTDSHPGVRSGNRNATRNTANKIPSKYRQIPQIHQNPSSGLPLLQDNKPCHETSTVRYQMHSDACPPACLLACPHSLYCSLTGLGRHSKLPPNQNPIRSSMWLAPESTFAEFSRPT